MGGLCMWRGTGVWLVRGTVDIDGKAEQQQLWMDGGVGGVRVSS